MLFKKILSLIPFSRIVLSLLAAHFIVAFGEKEHWWQLLLKPVYYVSLVGSAVIAFLLVSLVRGISLRLDRRFDWMEHPLPRIGWQILLGIFAPSIAAFLLATLYFAIFGFNILDTVYLRFDFPVIVLMIVMLNGFYTAYYFYKKSKIASANSETPLKEIFMVVRGSKTIPLPVKQICYFFRLQDQNFAKSFEGEDFVIPQSLDEIQQILDDRQFFRVNRQMLVNFKACHYFSFQDFGKLELFLRPPFKQPVIISQKRARQFKEWMER